MLVSFCWLIGCDQVFRLRIHRIKGYIKINITYTGICNDPLDVGSIAFAQFLQQAVHLLHLLQE
jgi:hypothetical protein